MDYNHQEIESKWISLWEREKLYETPQITISENKRYILETFPYPSGAGLHVGHTEGFTGSDITARYARMNGQEVLYPMGFDSFGLPAENYAIKTGLHPRINTDQAINNFQKQLRRVGFSYDWDREVQTHKPDYYKWTQWWFELLYKHGLAYKKEAMVNWDPVDKTVLANEQVLGDGTAERSGAKVEQIMMSQWFFKVTDFVEDKEITEGPNKGKVRKGLLNGLDDLDWPEGTKQQQRNWIGRSEGAIVRFPICNEDANFSNSDGDLNHLPYNTDLKAKARELRNNLTPAESLVWHNILKQDKTEHRFLRQKPILNYILDFYSPELKLAIEIDGDSHNYSVDYDKQRTDELGKLGIEILRFANEEVGKNLEGVSLVIHQKCKEKVSLLGGFVSSSPLSKGDVRRTEGLSSSPQNPQSLRASSFNKEQLGQGSKDYIEVFTTAHDTIYGVTFMVLAPEHRLVEQLTSPEQFNEVQEYIAKAKGKSQLQRTDLNKDKTGVFTGSYAINPINGEKVEIWIADYVLSTYGTGAVMAVPGNDERDYEFAQKYDLPIIYTVDKDEFVSYSEDVKGNLSNHTVINSGEFSGRTFDEARPAILQKLIDSGNGKKEINYKLRDWLVSRQRYWGAPIPIIYKPLDNQAEPGQTDSDWSEELVPEVHLPVILPDDVEFAPTGRSPLIDHEAFHESAAKYGDGAKREVDTMDTFVCSSWYFFRYCSPHKTDGAMDFDEIKKWMPVDQYIIGAEHTVLHLLYARFFTKVLFDLGYIDFDEPFTRLRHPGIILSEDSRKMSKRWGNVINPDDVCSEFGADTLRVYEMFMGPFDQSKPWNTNTVKGVKRFLDRVWRLQDMIVSEPNSSVDASLHFTIKKVTEDIPDLSFNTSVAEYMKFVNVVNQEGGLTLEQLKTFLKILAPFAPFMTEEIWQNLHEYTDFKPENSIHKQAWPEFDPSLIVEDEVTIVVQVNGKVRAEFVAAKDESEEVLLERAKVEAAKWIQGKQIKFSKVIPGKVVTLAVG
jgi:leucyl-tRNA synthetase